MRAFMVAAGSNDNLLVLFRDPVEVFNVSKETLVDVLCSVSAKSGALTIADIQQIVAGVGVFTVTRDAEGRLRSALRKTQKKGGDTCCTGTRM